MVANCRKLGVDEFVIITSPQAKEFYTKMGAIQTGEIESLLKKERKVNSRMNWG